MNYLLLTSYFPPENGSASHLFYELGRQLTRWGHRVDVLTGFPRYHVDAGQLTARYQWGLVLDEELEGMRVRRTRTLSLPRSVYVLRGLDQFVTAGLFFLRGLGLRGARHDVILVYSPPLPLGLAAWALARLTGSRFILNVQDLFPQSAIDLGAMKQVLLIRLFRALERFIYRKADLITVHSEGNRRYILALQIPPDKVRVMHNWVDTDRIRPGVRTNGFRRAAGIDDRTFLVSFAGVMGKSQDLDTVIEAARMLQSERQVLFLLVGDGVEKPRLQARVEALGLANVRFLGMQPPETYARILDASDACLVTLHREVHTPVVPSKLLGIMAAGRAVVASVPLAGDAPKIIQEAACGVCVEPGQPGGLAEAVTQLSHDPDRRAAYGRNGRAYAEEHFALARCARRYEGWAKEWNPDTQSVANKEGNTDE